MSAVERAVQVQKGNKVTVHATGTVQETKTVFWSTKNPVREHPPRCSPLCPVYQRACVPDPCMRRGRAGGPRLPPHTALTHTGPVALHIRRGSQQSDQGLGLRLPRHEAG